MTKNNNNNLFKISLLSIGDELCIGQTVNTNAARISAKCINTGASILTHSTIPDDKEIILNELIRLSKISNVVIITGGLGPTHDDFTKEVICEYLDTELILVEEIFAKLIKKYTIKKRNVNSAIIKEQAFIPEGTLALYNDIGSAPGIVFNKDNCMFFALPGVPNEVDYLVEQYIVGIIKKKIATEIFDVNVFKTIRTSGIFEVDLAKKIGNLDFLDSCSLAFLPSYTGVKLRLGVVAESFDVANTILNQKYELIKEKIGDYLNSSEDEELINTIAKLFIDTKTTISVAESCTGGLLGGALTDLPGSSAYFLGGFQTYTNKAKNEFLGVSNRTLEDYGAVSEQTAEEMAKNTREKFSSDIGVGITGIAGPSGGSNEKPVGTVWIGISTKSLTYAVKYIFSTNRKVNREMSVGKALELILKELKKLI